MQNRLAWTRRTRLRHSAESLATDKLPRLRATCRFELRARARACAHARVSFMFGEYLRSIPRGRYFKWIFELTGVNFHEGRRNGRPARYNSLSNRTNYFDNNSI